MGTKMQVLGGKIKFLSYKLSTQFGLVAQLVRATDFLYSGNANMWYERHPYKMEIVGSTPTTATMKEDEIDHINGDKMDDRIENLQVISKRNNIHKSHTRKEFVELTCPVCGEKFLYEKRNLNTHPNPCCSRKCGGIKSN